MLSLNLLQSELDRYNITSKIISDYYDARDRKPISENPEKIVVDIVGNVAEMPLYENTECENKED
jgi:hypothetical protein